MVQDDQVIRSATEAADELRKRFDPLAEGGNSDEVEASVVDEGEAGKEVPDTACIEEPEETPLDSKREVLADIEKRLESLEGMFKTKIDRSEYEIETLRRQSEEMQAYRDDLHARITHPILRELARIHAGMRQTLAYADANGDSAALGAAVEAYVDDISDVLADYGIEVFEPQRGDDFVSGACKIAGKEQTAASELVGKVAELKGAGYTASGKPFIPARVKVFVRAESAESQFSESRATAEEMKSSDW